MSTESEMAGVKVLLQEIGVTGIKATMKFRDEVFDYFAQNKGEKQMGECFLVIYVKKARKKGLCEILRDKNWGRTQHDAMIDLIDDLQNPTSQSAA